VEQSLVHLLFGPAPTGMDRALYPDLSRVTVRPTQPVADIYEENGEKTDGYDPGNEHARRGHGVSLR